jgi:cytochrome b subunit of formate dehydrogenase
MNRTLVLALGLVLLGVGIGVTYAEWASGGQPWGQLLGDNFFFARTLPFTIGLGIVVGYWRASGWRWIPDRRESDGAIRRFAPGTVLLHAVAGVALVALIATGGWQYLKGLLDAETPIYMGTVYRIHYLAASVLILVCVAFVTDWWLRGERSLTVAKGQWIRNLRGLAHELPRPVGTTLGYMLGLDLRRAAPPTEQFTYYERAFSFPTWTITIGLIILTGVIKAMRYIYPIPGDLLYWISAIHVGSGVLLGMKLLDHLRYVLAPSRWPLMASMANGWISEAYVRQFHPGWYTRLTSEGAASSVAAPTSTTPTSPTTPSRAVGSAGGAAS